MEYVVRPSKPGSVRVRIWQKMMIHITFFTTNFKNPYLQTRKNTIKYAISLFTIIILLSIILCYYINPHNSLITFDNYKSIDNLVTYNPVLKDDIGYIKLYENCQDSTYACWPGDKKQIIDWGISPGGTVGRFVFRYATNLMEPGEIIVRFYTGTNKERPYGNLIKEFTLSNLKGSPDHKIHSFDYDFEVPSDKTFSLPLGNFGYSFQVEKNSTGIKFARGGKGNDNMLWEGNKQFNRYLSSHYWSGLYMKLYSKIDSNENIRIIPDRLVFTENDILKNNYSTENDSYCQGKGIAVAIIDSGVDYGYPQLGNGIFPSEKIIGGYDFVDNDNDPYSTIEHGTLAALIVAGKKISVENQFYNGLANLSKLYVLRVKSEREFHSTYEQLSKAIDWCVSHQYDDPNNPILIINISYGGSRCFTECDSLVPFLTDSINKAADSGITILASSGNDGWKDSIRCPACINNVISVGAHNGFIGQILKSYDSPDIFSSTNQGQYPSDLKANNIWPYSNIYPELDCFGPSVLNVISKGHNLLYEETGSTSMACAYMTGIAACLQSASIKVSNRYLNPSEMKKLLSQLDEKIASDYSSDLAINIYDIIYVLFRKPKSFRIYNHGDEPFFINSIKSNNQDDMFIYPAKCFYIAPKDYQDIYVYLRNIPDRKSLEVFIEHGITSKNTKAADIIFVKSRLHTAHSI